MMMLIFRKASPLGAFIRLRALALLALLSAITADCSLSQDKLQVWREFVSLLRSGAMTADRVRPHQELEDSKQQLLGYIEISRQQALPSEWETDPEVIDRDSLLHYIISLTTNQQKVPYCFSFVTDNGQWYLRHVEAIFIRLDTLSSFPVTAFPDLDEGKKAWMREEVFWSFVVLNVYLPAERERGTEYALGLLYDGAGYFLAAKTWVPFEAPQRAFILYLCWEQVQLRGNGVTLVRLSDTEAIVELQSHFFAVYDIAGHLKPVIAEADYRKIFETIWQDRAQKAGWELAIKYRDNHVVELQFRRNG